MQLPREKQSKAIKSLRMRTDECNVHAVTTVLPPLLAVAEGANLLRISQRFVRLLILRGQLPCVRLGRRVLLRRCDLDRVIESGGLESTRSNGREVQP
jgi:excisionase family DNA binding protein